MPLVWAAEDPFEDRKKKNAGWDVPVTWKQADVKQAVDLVKEITKVMFPARPEIIPALWPIASPEPRIRDLDFGDAAKGSVDVAKLWASQSWLNVDRMLWHLKHAGEAMDDNPMTQMPIVMMTKDGAMIVDGHHRLGALVLLGVEKAPVWTLPVPVQPQEN